MSPQQFRVVPKNMDEFALFMNQMIEKMNDLEESHKEVKVVVKALEKKFWGLIVAVVVAIGSKYGLDLTGLAL